MSLHGGPSSVHQPCPYPGMGRVYEGMGSLGAVLGGLWAGRGLGCLAWL